MMALNNEYDDCVEALLNEFGTDNPEPSALLLAMVNSHYACTRLLLLEVGIDGVTPLMYYASLGNVVHVKHCLESPDLSKYIGNQTMNDWTALMFADAGGFTLCVKLRLAREQWMQDSQGETALMKAVAWNSNSVIALLLQKNFIEFGMKTHDGNTALMIAVQNNAPESVLLLQMYEQGLCDFLGNTVFMLVAQNGFLEIVEIPCP